ncbi:MAG: DUF4062 domain-containing protein, partial [Thermotogaceae bacterium]|nr:DUF4062 domain-containing protein [Thermotogaceae bacterium]
RKVFRVFVSSTFLDMKRERNVLQKKVFPRLREYCERHGASFQDIDLRWGVSDEVQKDQRTLQICLSEIERCQNLSPKPNFIILLGDRYGWEPLPYSIPSTEFDSLLPLMDDSERSKIIEWYRRDDNAIPSEYILQPRKDEYESYALWEEKERELREILRKAVDRSTLDEKEREKYFLSATHREIIHGALGIPEGKIAPQEHVVACFRKGEKDERLQRLEEELKDRLSKERTREYESLDNEKDEDEFSQFIYERLEETISLQLKDVQEIDELEEERNRHREYKEELLEDFCGREKILEEISEYIEGEDNRIFALTGESGSGKSSVMAKAIEQAQREKNVVIYRFCGITANSSNELYLLSQLCEEITSNCLDKTNIYAKRDDISSTEDDDKDGKDSYKPEQREVFGKFEKCLSISLQGRKLVVFVDALDQLSGNLAWLPDELTENTKIIVSFSKLKNPILKFDTHIIPDLDESETLWILNSILIKRSRKLEDCQREIVIGSLVRNRHPINLKLFSGIVESIHSYSALRQVKELCESFYGSFFSKMEREHTNSLTGTFFGYILCSILNGMPEDEIVDIISFDPEFFNTLLKDPHTGEEIKKTGRIPIVIWSRFFAQMEPYLSSKEADSAMIISLFHNSILEESRRRYGSNPDYYHEQLGKYGLSRLSKQIAAETNAIVSGYSARNTFIHLYEAKRFEIINEEFARLGKVVGFSVPMQMLLEKLLDWVVQNYEFESTNPVIRIMEKIVVLPGLKEISKFLDKKGTEYRVFGYMNWALLVFELLANLQRRLIRRSKKAREILSDYCTTINNLGKIHKVTGKTVECLKCFKRSRRIRKELLKEEPYNQEYLKDLAVSSSYIGREYRNIGRIKIASKYFSESLEIRRKLASKEPDREDFQRELSVALINIGKAYRTNEDRKAFEYFNESLAIRRELANKNPYKEGFRRDLSLVLGELGRTHMKFNDLDKAREYFNEALIIRRAIAKKNPNKMESQKDYAIALRGFGLTFMKKETASRAIECFEESLFIRRRLLEKSPERIDIKRDLSVILIDLGKAKMLIEDYGNALKLIGEALSIRREICQLEPERLVFLKDLRLNLSKMSLCLRKLGRKVEAYEFAEEAITISERILEKSDDKERLRIELVERILEISELSDDLKKTFWLLKAREILESLEKHRTTDEIARSLKATIDKKLRS